MMPIVHYSPHRVSQHDHLLPQSQKETVAKWLLKSEVTQTYDHATHVCPINFAIFYWLEVSHRSCSHSRPKAKSVEVDGENVHVHTDPLLKKQFCIDGPCTLHCMVASFPCMFLIPYLGHKFLKNGEYLTLYKSQGTQQQGLTCIKYSRNIWLESSQHSGKCAGLWNQGKSHSNPSSAI